MALITVPEHRVQLTQILINGQMSIIRYNKYAKGTMNILA